MKKERSHQLLLFPSDSPQTYLEVLSELHTGEYIHISYYSIIDQAHILTVIGLSPIVSIPPSHVKFICISKLVLSFCRAVFDAIKREFVKSLWWYKFRFLYCSSCDTERGGKVYRCGMRRRTRLTRVDVRERG
jgi:hypothetical protein